MPRGDNPNSRANLKKLTSDEARLQGKNGGKKSAQVRRQLKTFKELDDLTTTNKDRQIMLEMLMKRAKQGNLKAFEVYRDTVGMKPVEKVIVAEVEQSVIDEVENLLND